MAVANERYMEMAQAELRLDDKLVQKYCPGEPVSTDGRAWHNVRYWLQGTIQIILTKREDREVVTNDIRSLILEEECGEDILAAHIDLDELLRDVIARVSVTKDFLSALKNCSSGRNLSMALGFSFAPDELLELGELHRNHSEVRAKIEELLEDCNFHSECRLLIQKKYDSFAEHVNMAG